VGAAPPDVASAPKVTFWTGGVVAWTASVGTTWHSEQATGAAATSAAGLGFMCVRCAPTTDGAAPGGARGGAEERSGSTPGTVPTRDGSPWQLAQEPPEISGLRFR